MSRQFLIIIVLCLSCSLAAFAQISRIQVTELYEVSQGNVALTSLLPSPLAGEESGVRGEVTNQYIYSPYGMQKNLNHPCSRRPFLFNQTRKPLNLTCNQFGYTGQATDPSTNLMMLGGFRNYAPGIDRFIQPDTYNSFSKHAINNLSAYVKDNPVTLTDPSGHMVFGVGSFVWNSFVRPTLTTVMNPGELIKGGIDFVKNPFEGFLNGLAQLIPQGSDTAAQLVQSVAEVIAVMGDPGAEAKTGALTLESQGVAIKNYLEWGETSVPGIDGELIYGRHVDGDPILTIAVGRNPQGEIGVIFNLREIDAAVAEINRQGVGRVALLKEMHAKLAERGVQVDTYSITFNKPWGNMQRDSDAMRQFMEAGIGEKLKDAGYRPKIIKSRPNGLALTVQFSQTI